MARDRETPPRGEASVPQNGGTSPLRLSRESKPQGALLRGFQEMRPQSFEGPR